MRKLLFAALILCSVSCYAQTTTISATVTDSTSTVWANGTWKVEFVPNPSTPNPAVYNINGTPLDPAVTNQNAAMNGSGALSFSVYQNAAITPIGSSWKLTVCPNASAPCGIYGFTATGSSMNLSSSLTAVILPPSFRAVAGTYGYNDAEAQIQTNPGSNYFNVASLSQRCYNGTAWQACASAGGFPSAVPCAIASGCTAATNAQDARTNLTVPGFIAISGSPTVACSASVNDGSYYVDISTFLEYKCILASAVWAWHQTGVGAIYNIPLYGTVINFYDVTGTYLGNTMNVSAGPTTGLATICSLSNYTGSNAHVLDYWCEMRFAGINNKWYFGADNGNVNYLQSGLAHDIQIGPGCGGVAVSCAPVLTLFASDQSATFANLVRATLYQETLTTPASSSAACTAGQFTDDANYHYVCTATNTWKRVALSTF